MRTTDFLRHLPRQNTPSLFSPLQLAHRTAVVVVVRSGEALPLSRDDSNNNILYYADKTLSRSDRGQVWARVFVSDVLRG